MTGLPVIPPLRALDPPPGYKAYDLVDPFEAELGPLFRKQGNEGAEKKGGPVELAAFVDDRHCAPDGRAAPGALWLFADAFCGWTGFFYLDLEWCVTVRMSLELLNRPKNGALLTAQGRIVHHEDKIMRIDASFEADGMAVMLARSTWKITGG